MDIYKDGAKDPDKIINYLNIDVSKLMSYFELRITVRNRTNGLNTFSIIPFRQCTKEDTDYNFQANQMDPSKLLCPDLTPESKKFFTVKGFYNNVKERMSFSVDINKCNKFSNSSVCKVEEETKKLFDSVYFQFIVIS